MSNESPPDWVLRVVVALLAASMAAPILLTAGRGVMCIVRGGCPFEEYSYSMEQFASHIATPIALIMALLNRKP
jgi:hypothetical protein